MPFRVSLSTRAFLGLLSFPQGGGCVPTVSIPRKPSRNRATRYMIEPQECLFFQVHPSPQKFYLSGDKSQGHPGSHGQGREVGGGLWSVWENTSPPPPHPGKQSGFCCTCDSTLWDGHVTEFTFLEDQVGCWGRVGGGAEWKQLGGDGHSSAERRWRPYPGASSGHREPQEMYTVPFTGTRTDPTLTGQGGPCVMCLGV